MTRRQLFILYALVVFMMTWGIDIISIIKYKKAIEWGTVFNIWALAQLIYSTLTLVLTRLLFKKYFKPRRYFILAGGIVLLIVFFILFRYILEQLIVPAFFQVSNYPATVDFVYYAMDNLYYAILYIILGIFIFLLDSQIGFQKKQSLLTQRNREAELQFLRSQINPHFLFNTLNNIYSLIYEKSDKAPAATLQLSELMRYSLYEKKEWVPISKEWDYILRFIDLQKLRFEQEPLIDLQVNGEMENSVIAPYLLIPFVENAFKHGDFKDKSQALKLALSIRADGIVFNIKNKIGHGHKDNSGGIGLENVRRRLELIYPEKHRLETKQTGNIFEVKLELHV